MGQRPESGVIRVLEEALAAAKRGEAREVFVLLKHPDGEWDCDYLVRDTDDLATELRTQRIRLGEGITTPVY